MKEPKPINILEQMELEEFKRRYPENPYPLAKKYKVSKANGLTGAVIKYIQLNHGQAERISVTGRRIDNTKVVENVLGQKMMIGSVDWIKSSMQKGSADISAIIKTRSGVIIPWKIEIKIGKDKIRPDQVTYSEQVKRAGGHYSTVKTFDDFFEQYNTLVND